MPTYEYECATCGYTDEKFLTLEQFDDNHTRMCRNCTETMWIKPSFSRPLVAEEVVEARKEKAPEIEAYHKITQANFDAETYKRHKAAHRIEGQKDRARQYRWTSKTFIPGGGVMTKYPKGLEKD